MLAGSFKSQHQGWEAEALLTMPVEYLPRRDRRLLLLAESVPQLTTYASLPNRLW